MTPTPPLALSTIQLVHLDELVALQIRNAHGEALIALQGAQVLQYTPKGQQPLIWLSEQAQFKQGRSVRGGIPVCWPWFGDLARNPEPVQQAVQGAASLPAHGLVRGQTWRLESASEDQDATQVVLSYPTPAGLAPTWPHLVDLRLSIRLGASLQLELSNHNSDSQSVALSQALHTYFAVSDVRQVQVEGLKDVPYLDTLDQWRTKQDTTALRFQGETDRVYQQVPAALAILDPAWQRRIQIRATNSTSAVVWNPWVEKSRRLSEFADDAWQRMLCIETANVMDDCLTLAPGETHRLRVEYWVEALA